jgi:hypothetical protein
MNESLNEEENIDGVATGEQISQINFSKKKKKKVAARGIKGVKSDIPMTECQEEWPKSSQRPKRKVDPEVVSPIILFSDNHYIKNVRKLCRERPELF